MTATQIIFGILIIVVLVSLALYYGRQQWHTLRTLRAAPEMAPGEYLFLRNQAWRRLAGSVLMLLFAGLFVGMFFLEGPAGQIVAVGETARSETGQRPELDPDQRAFFHYYAAYWTVLMLLLLALIGLAGYELFAIRRFGVQNFRRIQEERRAMIARETARIRGQRDGQGS
jgi:magnesium-transporting ATPase (P-type)